MIEHDEETIMKQYWRGQGLMNECDGLGIAVRRSWHHSATILASLADRETIGLQRAKHWLRNGLAYIRTG